jgi:O-acetyl-ADP-ribose deacetylase (regulator of RNase III)
MIKYIQGNLLDAEAEALVNTVNELGVMGKGIALMFREAFPANTKAYQEACKQGKVQVGRMLVTETNALVGPRWIINFPTKKDWKHPSKLAWVHDGLKDLVRVIRERQIKSIALPPLGCGNGGLEWVQVRKEIEAAFADLDDVEVIVFEPTAAYQNAPKRQGVEELTPARAFIAELVRRYSILGIDCTNLEVQKLAWFLHRKLQEMGCPNILKLHFSANKYGPYADELRHLLDALDGSYLHCEKRLSDAGPLDLIWFEDSKKEGLKTYLESEPARLCQPALEKTAEVIAGFESPLGMELLATVDWLLYQEKCQPTIADLQRGLDNWPGGKLAAQRKRRLFDERLLQLALDRLVPQSAAVS